MNGFFIHLYKAGPCDWTKLKLTSRFTYFQFPHLLVLYVWNAKLWNSYGMGENPRQHKQALWINLLYWYMIRTGTRKNYRIWFLPTSGISSCSISQGNHFSKLAPLLQVLSYVPGDELKEMYQFSLALNFISPMQCAPCLNWSFI